MTTDPIVEAVNLLIDADDYSARVQELTRSLETPKEAVSYTGSMACLNALLAIGKDDRNAFERVVRLIEAKRKENPKMAKRDYQRDIMRDRRKRMAKAILLHEARSGPLRGAARAAEMASIRTRWTRAKAEFIVDREASSAQERREATAAFWAMVDRQLDANVANLHKTAAVA